MDLTDLSQSGPYILAFEIILTIILIAVIVTLTKKINTRKEALKEQDRSRRYRQLNQELENRHRY